MACVTYSLSYAQHEKWVNNGGQSSNEVSMFSSRKPENTSQCSPKTKTESKSPSSSNNQQHSNSVWSQMATNPLIQTKLTVGVPGDEFEQEADAVSDQVMRMPVNDKNEALQKETPSIQSKSTNLSLSPIQRKSKSASSQAGVPGLVKSTINSPGNGSPLNGSIRSRVEPVLGADLSNVRVHEGSSAKRASQSLNAKAFTHQSSIFLGHGQSGSDLQLMAHEATHVVQQLGGAKLSTKKVSNPHIQCEETATTPAVPTLDASANELSSELNRSLPDNPTNAQRDRHTAITEARQRLKVISTSVEMEIHDLFSTVGGTTTISLPANTTVRFSSNIAAGLRHGLQNTAAQLISNDTLTANTTIMLALDLARYGGAYSSYRITRLDLGSLGIEVLVERQGTIGVEGLQSEERTAMSVRFSRFGFTRRGFSQEEFDQVLIGLSEVPDTQLSQLSGLTFERNAVDAEDPAAGGHYDQSVHAIRIFDRAYSSGLTRLGSGTRPLSIAAFSTIHEIGHALDLADLRTTADTTTAAQNALLAEFGTGGTGYSIPDRRDPARARYDPLNQGVITATAAENAARSLSGARWSGGNPSTVTDNLTAGAQQPAFRQAAIDDGINSSAQFPTTYPNPDSVWQEYFAESFALYQSSPGLLGRIRPHVFAYMQQQFQAAP